MSNIVVARRNPLPNETPDERLARIIVFGLTEEEKIAVKKEADRIEQEWLKEHKKFFKSEEDALSYFYYCEYQD